MSDLADKLSEMLANPEIMRQVQSLSSIFGKSDSANSENNTNNNLKNDDNNDNNQGGLGEIPPEMLKGIMKMMPLLSSMKKEDKYSRFLLSLRPLLSVERQKKLDEAAKIMGLVRMLPLLKDQGIF